MNYWNARKYDTNGCIHYYVYMNDVDEVGAVTRAVLTYYCYIVHTLSLCNVATQARTCDIVMGGITNLFFYHIIHPPRRVPIIRVRVVCA